MPTFETPGRVLLDVSIPAGRVAIQTWNEPRVDVEVTPGRGDEASQQAAAETRIEAAERGGRHEIVVRAPKREGRFGFLGRSPELEVVIRCPEGADLELNTQSEDLDARGGLGDITARSSSGDAMLGDTGSLSFSTASGDLSAGAVAGSLTAKSASGDVSVRAVGETATVNTVSGDVRVSDTAGVAVVSTVSGDVELEAAGGGARVNSGGTGGGARAHRERRRPGLAVRRADRVGQEARRPVPGGRLPGRFLDSASWQPRSRRRSASRSPCPPGRWPRSSA